MYAATELSVRCSQDPSDLRTFSVLCPDRRGELVVTPNSNVTVTYSESMLLPSSLLLSDCSDLYCINVSWFNFILFRYSGCLCFGKSPHYSLCFWNLITADSTRLLRRFQAHNGILGWRVSWRGFTQYVLVLNFAPLVF